MQLANDFLFICQLKIVVLKVYLIFTHLYLPRHDNLTYTVFDLNSGWIQTVITHNSKTQI